MIGALLGDIIGSPFEFDRGKKSKSFKLFSDDSHFTDDSVMTIAIADALLKSGEKATVETIRTNVTEAMQSWGHLYPNAGYGRLFRKWLWAKQPQPYGSYGNGSAMRVSAAGWLYQTLERTRAVARATAEVTHNHPEGIKGAEAVASVIFLARSGCSKKKIKAYVEQEFCYNLDRSCASIRPGYHHVETCQETVPEAIVCFLEGHNFEDVLRNAISLGGDTDTLGAIAGSMAEAFYSIPSDLKATCVNNIPLDFVHVLNIFTLVLRHQKNPKNHQEFLNGNIILDKAIQNYIDLPVPDNLDFILFVLQNNMLNCCHVLLPVTISEPDSISEESHISFEYDMLPANDGELFLPVFTSAQAYDKGPVHDQTCTTLENALVLVADHENIRGIVINAWDEQPFYLERDVISTLLEHTFGTDETIQ